jgi:mono/diheme cytochrome c family protein
VTFSSKIVPLLANNCLSCHSNATAASAGNNIRLENYADVIAQITSIAGAIKQTGGYSPMPKNGGKLNACMISQFDIWVRNGAPAN